MGIFRFGIDKEFLVKNETSKIQKIIRMLPYW